MKRILIAFVAVLALASVAGALVYLGTRPSASQSGFDQFKKDVAVAGAAEARERADQLAVQKARKRLAAIDAQLAHH